MCFFFRHGVFDFPRIDALIVESIRFIVYSGNKPSVNSVGVGASDTPIFGTFTITPTKVISIANWTKRHHVQL